MVAEQRADSAGQGRGTVRRGIPFPAGVPRVIFSIA